MKGPSGELFVDDGGSGGLPVVFVHSLAGNTGQWAEQLAHLRRSRRAIALDLRGHGRSELPKEGPFTVEAFAQDVAAVVDGLELERFVLVGHSLGGAVSVAYAGAHPERVAGLFLLDPASDGRLVPPEESGPMLQALRSDGYAQGIEAYWSSMLTPSTEQVKERVLSDLRATPKETVVGALEALLVFDPVTPLSGYNGPKRSVITYLNETPGSLHVLTRGLPFEKIDGTGHWVQLDAPDKVNAALDGFLADIR